MTPRSDERRVHVLRPRTDSALISAQTFEHGFVLGMGEHLRIEAVDATSWAAAVLGDDDRRVAARSLAARWAHADFLCPGTGALAWTPELLRLRNLADAPVRALIIAHSPGVFVPEWALLAPLLRAGDRIVAPSETAAAVIDMLCPQLSAHVRVIPHPIPPWLTPERVAERSRREPPRLISLGRLVRDKLLHRQLEALAILRERGRTLQLELAGPLAELGADGVSAYVRSLQAKIERLKLGAQVRLCGTIESASAKLDFVAGAAMLLNLSVSLEESFGKSIAEALSCGVPSLCTRWGGLAETGAAGAHALPVAVDDYGVDVDAETIADAIEAVLADPPTPACCYEISRRYAPERIAARYREVLDEARDEFAAARRDAHGEPAQDRAAAPTTGLLARTAPLTTLSWHEAMDLHRHELRAPPDLRGLTNPQVLSPGAQLRGLLCLALRAPVQRVQAGLELQADEPSSGTASLAPVRGPIADEFLARCEQAVHAPGTRASRVIIVDLMQRLGRDDVVERGLSRLRAEGLDSKGMRYLEIETALRAGGPARAVEMCEQEFGEQLGLREHDSHRLLQYARACHQLGEPERALAALRRWTTRFPDSPDAAGLWQQRALLSLLAEHDADEARTSLQRCLALTGPRPELSRLLAALSEDG